MTVNYNSLTVQETWSSGVKTLQSIFWNWVPSNSLQHRTHLLQSHPVRVQLDSAKAVAYINLQEGTRSWAAVRDTKWILSWAEIHISALYPPHSWPIHLAGRLSNLQHQDPGKWSLHLEIFQNLSKVGETRYGQPVLQVKQQTVQTCSQVQEFSGLVIPSIPFRLTYAFSFINVFLQLLRRIELESVFRWSWLH